jgi:hypothetical protein
VAFFPGAPKQVVVLDLCTSGDYTWALAEYLPENQQLLGFPPFFLNCRLSDAHRPEKTTPKVDFSVKPIILVRIDNPAT